MLSRIVIGLLVCVLLVPGSAIAKDKDKGKGKEKEKSGFTLTSLDIVPNTKISLKHVYKGDRKSVV